MKIHPLDNYVLLKEKTLVEQVATKVLLPEETDMDRPDIGVVVEFGKDVKTPIKEVGLEVLFQRHLFTKVFLDNKEEYWLGSDQAVIATVTNE